MTYQPFLPEAAAGSVEPSHVVVPLRRVLRTAVSHRGGHRRSSTRARWPPCSRAEGDVIELGYDVLVVCPGSVSRLLPIPGLAEHGIGFKTIGEAIYLRNHVLARLDLADVTSDPTPRRRLSTFVFVGGGYAGVEAIAELQDMARYASTTTSDRPDDMRWVLVEAAERIMPEVSAGMALYTVERLRGRRHRRRLDTRARTRSSAGTSMLSDGEEFDADTLVWTAGVKAQPDARPHRPAARRQGPVALQCQPDVSGIEGVFCAGDCAAVPDLSRRTTRTP